MIEIVGLNIVVNTNYNRPIGVEVGGCMDAVTDDFVPFLHHQLGSVFNLWRITGMLFY